MRRNDLDICADILRVAKRRVKKIQIACQANFNFKIVKKYLKRLLENGWLDSYDRGKLFHTTNNRVNFLEQYSKLLAPMSSITGE